MPVPVQATSWSNRIARREGLNKSIGVLELKACGVMVGALYT